MSKRGNSQPCSKCLLGWSDIALFTIFETDTMVQIRYIFRSPIPKNQRICLRASSPNAPQSFHLLKITETLNMYIYLCKYVNTLLLLQRTMGKKKILKSNF